MDDVILIKATNGNNEPKQLLNDREFGYNRREKALYIGDNGQRVKLCQADDVGRIANKVETLGDDANLAQVVAKINEVISVLQDSGLMNT
jgi:hypothetical protein